jgi:hypothetical protein
MLSASSLLVIWVRYPSNSRSRLTSWWYWLAASMVGAIFPMLVGLQQLLAPRFDALWFIILIQAVLTAALTFLSQVYHYSAFYYGRLHGLGGLDPIGVGLPTRVQLACEEKACGSLQGLGVSINDNGITENLFLIDETDRHYLVGFQREAERGAETLKIEKSLVRAILYKPDQSQPAETKSGHPGKSTRK